MSREVLAPPLQKMGTRSYRVNVINEDFAGNSGAFQRQRQQSTTTKVENRRGGGDGGYVEQDLYDVDDDEEEEEGSATYTVEELPNSQFKLTMHVAPALYGGLIGTKGSTKRRIESETRTEIFVPQRREGGGKGKEKEQNVIITGKSRSSVCAARRKIKLLMVSLRKRLRPTHFLAVALNFGEIRENYVKFKNAVLAADLPGVDEQLFQSEACIHLTLNTCVLLDDAERAKGLELMQSSRDFLADLKTPFEVKVSGLEIMNDDPSAVRILYARVEAPELQEFANRANGRYIQSGLSQDEYGRGGDVKLHMTLMNVSFDKDASPEHDRKVRRNFDAREILKRWNSQHFGTAQCNEVSLCLIGSKEPSEFYKTSGTLKLAEDAKEEKGEKAKS